VGGGGPDEVTAEGTWLRDHTRRIRSERGIAAIAAMPVAHRAARINPVRGAAAVPPPGVPVLLREELLVPLAIRSLRPREPLVVFPLRLLEPLEVFLPVLAATLAPIIVAPRDPDGREGERCDEHQDESHSRSPHRGMNPFLLFVTCKY